MLAVLQKMSTQVHKYVELFDMIKVGPTSKLVYREAAGVSVQNFSQVSSYESAYNDIKQSHAPSRYIKNKSLHKAIVEQYGVIIPLWVCNAFGRVCPVCILRTARKKPKAGHQPIVTKGFGTHSQIG